MYFYDPKELAPGVRTRTFWGENTLLSIGKLDACSEVPHHTHPHKQARMMVAGESKLLKPGGVDIIAGSVENLALSASSSARALDIFSSVRQEFKY